MSHLDLDVTLSLDAFDIAIAHRFPLAGVTALFGPSGAGKSTLLRVIAGLERAARGRIAFDGETWQSADAARFVPAHRRGVGYVFQDARLFPHLSVAGNLAYAESRSRAARGPIAYDDVVGALDLAPLLARRPASLSGGERQRVALGRTLLTRPRLLLMDEPLAALDGRRKAEILPYLERLPQAFAVPVIYVTHAMEEVARLADRLAVIAAGRIVADGPVHEVLERLDLGPATGRFEAGVILDVQVSGHDADFRLTHLDLHGQTLVIPAIDAAVGSALRLRVRARDVALATRRPDAISIRNVLAARVREVVAEPDTAFAEVLVDVGGSGLRARLTRRSVADLALAPGMQVYALIKSTSTDHPTPVAAARAQPGP